MTNLVLKPLAPALALLLALAACSPAPDGDSQVTTKDTPSPVGNVWRWTALTGAESLEVANPGRYTLELMEDGRYAVRADCNSGGGAYTLEGNSLTLGPGPMTLAACGPDSLDTRFAVLLGKVSGFKMDGERLLLDLGGGAGSLVFEAMQRISLAGTSWLVRGYNNGKGGVVSVGAGATLHAAFTEDGIVRGSAGCNNFTGSYETDGPAITTGPTAATRKMCMGEGLMEQESAFLAALSSITTWEIRGERLQLRRADGALALDLVSAVTGTVAYPVITRDAPLYDVEIQLDPAGS